MSESARRRRPLRPLSPQLTEPVRDFTEELRQIYWERTELNQRELALALHLTKSPVSRYLSGQEIIPANSFAEFCRIAGLTAREQQRLGRLREKAAEAGTPQPGTARPAHPGEAAPAVPRRPALIRRLTSLAAVSGRPRTLPAAVVLVLVLLGVGAAGIVMALNGDDNGGSSPAAAAPGHSGGTGCPSIRIYRVIDDGDILDGERNDIGDVRTDDVFGLDKAPADRPYRFRDYGHVIGSKVKGYVDQAKLKPLGRRCVRDVERNSARAEDGNAPHRPRRSPSPSR